MRFLWRKEEGGAMAKIYLIRHCESEGNACRRTHAQTDGLVTRKGYLQNEALRQRFQDIPVDAVYSSDAYRSVVTVEPIAKERGLPVKVRIQLREVTTGIWEDMAWGNIARDYPDANQDWVQHPWAHTTPGASTFQQVADRLIFALRRIAQEVGDGTAVCVSHSCTIKAGLCAILGRPLSDIHVVGHGDNTAVSLLNVDADGKFTVEYMNDSSHLPPELARAWSGVAGSDVNMTVDRVESDQDWEALMELVRTEHRQRCGADDRLDEEVWRTEAKRLLSEYPDYIAICRLKGEHVGYIRMEPAANAETGHIRAMYVTPELQGKGYTEQLFGYASHVFRYQGKKYVSVELPTLPEDRRVAERFAFVTALDRTDRLVLALYNPGIPYPVLA